MTPKLSYKHASLLLSKNISFHNKVLEPPFTISGLMFHTEMSFFSGLFSLSQASPHQAKTSVKDH